MMIGAKIMLSLELDVALNGLAHLAEAEWMISLPQRQAAHHEHPAGSARPDLFAGRWTGLIAVSFGKLAAPATDRIVLPVSWEPVEPRAVCPLQLDGSITLAPDAAGGHSALTLNGVCTVPPGALAVDDCEQVRLEVIEVSRGFITDVARDVIQAVDPDQGPPGMAWAW